MVKGGYWTPLGARSWIQRVSETAALGHHGDVSFCEKHAGIRSLIYATGAVVAILVNSWAGGEAVMQKLGFPVGGQCGKLFLEKTNSLTRRVKVID